MNFTSWDPQLPGCDSDPRWMPLVNLNQLTGVTHKDAWLIYCTPRDEPLVYNWAKTKKLRAMIKRNCEDPAIFRNMKGYCLIVTNPLLMRGVDYSVGPERDVPEYDGIALVLMRVAESTRELLQISSRVGRYGEEKHHFHFTSLPQSLIDYDAALAEFVAFANLQNQQQQSLLSNNQSMS